MEAKCSKCRDGMRLDGNASGHAGERLYPCSCDMGLAIIVKDVTANDGYYGEQLGAGINRLRRQLAQRDTELAALKGVVEKLHPRVLKLAGRDEPFIVIGCREPYFADAYKMIRTQEREQVSWTAEDERCFEVALIAWACAREAAETARQACAEGEKGAKNG